MDDPSGDFSFFENAAAQRAQRRINLNLRFYTLAVENKPKSLEAGRPIFDQVDMCELNVPGSRDTVDKKCSNPDFMAKFGEQYKMWKETQEQPVDGTPLDQVPFLNISQIRELQVLNVRALEQLAGLSDNAVQKLGMGYVELRRKAQAYMTAGKDSAEQTRLITENENLKRDLARLTMQVANLTQRIENLMAGGIGPTLHPSVVVNGGPAPLPQPVPAAAQFDVAAFIKEEIRKAMEK